MSFRARGLAALLATVVAAGCSGDVMSPDMSPSPRAASARGPAGGFPLVLVREGASASTAAGAPVVDNFVDALDRVAAGGTIRVHDGTYDVANVPIDKAVTIEPAAGAAPLIRTGLTNGFRITNVAQGTVTIRGLSFEIHGLRAILAFNQYDQVIVEDSRFISTAGPQTPFGLPIGFVSVGVAANLSPTSKFIARRNTFVGGHWALIASGARAEFIGNTATDLATGGIQFETFSIGRMEGNTLDRCGRSRCIGVATGSAVVVSGNVIRNAHPRRVRSGISLFGGGEATITDNDVVGTGGAGSTLFDHAFDFGIEASGNPMIAPAVVTIARNTVGGAYQGIWLASVMRATVDDNRVNPCGGWSCITVFGNALVGANIQVRRNTLRSVLERRTFFALQSSWAQNSGTLSFTDNDIAGATPPSSPADPSTYSLQIAYQNGNWFPPGLEGIAQGAAVEFSRNRISNAQVGVRAFHGGTIEGRDNVFTGIFGEAFGAHDRGIARLRFNDVIDYVSPFGLSGSPIADLPHRGTLDAQCNYWGGGAPHNVHPSIPPSSYTPYATAPIAGTGATSCQ